MRPDIIHVAHDDNHDQSAVSPPKRELQTPPRLQLVPSLFKDPIEAYLSSLAQSGRRSMRSKLEKVARLFDIPLVDFGLTLLTYQTTITAKSILQEMHPPSYVNDCLAALRGAATQAWGLGVITAEELQKIKSVKGPKGSTIPPGRALSDEDLNLLVGACENDTTPAGVRDTAIIGLMFSAGLRRHECALLRLMDYSAQARAVLVRGKGNKEDIVPLEDSGTARALNDWLKLRGRAPGPLFCRVLKGGTIALTSKHLSSETIYSIVKKRASDAGIDTISPHDARRTLATRLEESGASTHSVQLLLRHSSPSTTARYFRRNDKTKRHAASLVSLPYKGRRITPPTMPAAEQLELSEGGSGDGLSGPS